GDALPPRASWRRDHRRGARRPAVDRARSGGEPATRSEGDHGLAVELLAPHGDTEEGRREAPRPARGPCVGMSGRTMNEPVKKAVLAYSGGPARSGILKWLIETYHCEVVAFCADLGQGDEIAPVEAKARATGATEVFVEDLREEF